VLNLEPERTNLISYCKESWSKFCKDEIGLNGSSLFIRASAGKILWVVFLLQIGNMFPIQGVLYRNISILSAIAIFNIIWKSVIGNHLPKFIGELLSGDICFQIDTNSLNKYIMILLGIDITLYFTPLQNLINFPDDKK